MRAKIKQIFCRHIEVSPHRGINKYGFRNLQGETIYYKCDRCNKIVRQEFMTNEEYMMNFK